MLDYVKATLHNMEQQGEDSDRRGRQGVPGGELGGSETSASVVDGWGTSSSICDMARDGEGDKESSGGLFWAIFLKFSYWTPDWASLGDALSELQNI
ncbi:hypothetical protein BRADI_4g21731v3 [Brachypodium distachyon]|uniref:Uncharacterized protein n=1 Tax=Brachypodium distachyon TaxID=15368 RepID=A0A0Q3EMT5_BRADI|nr:hypothetical protein BRADI_4g21731v3 [Brachypodium distachyon]